MLIARAKSEFYIRAQHFPPLDGCLAGCDGRVLLGRDLSDLPGRAGGEGMRAGFAWAALPHGTVDAMASAPLGPSVISIGARCAESAAMSGDTSNFLQTSLNRSLVQLST